MSRCLAVLLGLLGGALSAAEPGDVVVPGESRAAFAKLEEARKTALSPKWSDGLGALIALSDGGGGELTPLLGPRLVQTRILAQRNLSLLPRITLEAYRRRAEPQARRWVNQSLEEREPALLLRVVEEAFATRASMQALDMLGDLAFVRGRFGEAELWWRMLSPLGGRLDTDELIFPDAPSEVAARVQAKQMLARLYDGRAGFEADLIAYRRAHPKAEGSLAGRKGLYADTLAAVAKERAARPLEMGGDWTTFGGDGSRQGIVPAGDRFLDQLARLARSGPTWRFDLQSRTRMNAALAELTQTEVDAARRMAFHPAVVGDTALVADGRYVTAYDLRTGKPETWFDLEEQQLGGVKVNLATPTIPDLRYSVTVTETAVFARLGCQAIRDIRPDPKTNKLTPDGESVLVSLALKPRQGERKRWIVRAVDPGRKEYAVFEGAPVAGLNRVWIAATRFEAGKVVTAIHCYPADPEDTSPVPLWRTDIAQTSELQPAGNDNEKLTRRHRQHLLTLAGSRVVYCTHSGVIAALDARTGRPAWTIRYPRRDLTETEDEPVLRDLAPPLFANGKVYVAPADSERMYCLDPYTGAVVWQRDRLDVVHLLGVGQGRLIFTTYRNGHLGIRQGGGLRAVRADDGRDAGGWQLPDAGGGLTPMGRGILVGDLVLWPTGRKPCGVVAVRQEDGRQPDNPALLHRIPVGNLVYANGNLIVADQRTLWAFVPPEKLPDDDKAALDGRESIRRARAAANRGEREKAVELFDAVLKSREVPTRLVAEARRERTEAMIAAAKDAVARKKPDEAVKWLTEASQGGERVYGLVSAAELWTQAGEARRADEAWRSLFRLNDPAIVEDRDGRPQRLTRMARTRIGAYQDAKRPEITERAKPPSPVSLTLPLRAELALTLPETERFLPCESLDTILSWSSKGELVCRSRDSGEPRWRCALPFAPTFATSGPTGILVAGPRGIALIDEPGERLWFFDAPPQRLYPRSPSPGLHVSREGRRGDDLSRFHLVGSHLVFTQGDHTLFGMDLLTGEIAWKYRPLDAGLGLPAPYGRIHHLLPLGENRLLTQVSGRRLLLDVATGKVEEDERDDAHPWPRPPLRVKDGILVTDAGHIQMLDAITLRERWAFTPPGRTTRTGGAPLLVSNGERLAAVVPENLGLRLFRLDPATGKPIWSRFIEGDPVHLAEANWCLDADRLFHADAGTLRTWAVADGKPGWSVSLSGADSWRVARSNVTLLAWPATVPAVAFRFRWLSGALQWQSGPLPTPDAVLPVFCFDAADGALVQRLNLPADRPVPRVARLPEERGLFPTLEAGLPYQEGPSVRWDHRGLLLAVGRQVRFLESDR